MRILKQRKMYEGECDMLYNKTYNLDQVACASEGNKDAQQIINVMKAANKELKRMMTTVRIEDIDSMLDEMMDLMDVSNEIQETLGISYAIPRNLSKEALLDALEADMDLESNSVPWYLQPDKETDLFSELNYPAAPSGHAAVLANQQQEDELGLSTVPHASIRI
ncbi:vacuolar protein sorting-associated protein 60.1-like [Triticum urartu]|nr:vacuolar protein sorting-associated protein 60.1-like [Triticum urartu]XP_048560304.1 vacuolar protein sorting-associated protein 60.1-like [Triticum urartu]